MNPSLKQHRHPGLWSLPQRESKPISTALTRAANVQPLLAKQANWNELAQLRQLFASAKPATAQKNRWITLIGQPSDMSIADIRDAIHHAGIDAETVRWIRPSDNESKAWAAEQACLLDNSAVVIAWLGECQQRDTLRLQLARKHTQAQVLLLHSFANTTPLH